MMEICILCNSDYEKSFNCDHYKSVKHLEKKSQKVFKKCYSKKSSSGGDSHLSSVWFEDCDNKTDKTRHF